MVEPQQVKGDESKIEEKLTSVSNFKPLHLKRGDSRKTRELVPPGRSLHTSLFVCSRSTPHT